MGMKMGNSNALYNIELVNNRLFQGGKVLSLWQMFRAGQLTGHFIFKGQDWSTTVGLEQGNVLDLTYQERQRKVRGLDGFRELKRALSNDTATRFSIMVPEETENP